MKKLTNVELAFTLLNVGLFSQFVTEALYLFGFLGYWESWPALVMSGLVWGTGGLKVILILMGVEEK